MYHYRNSKDRRMRRARAICLTVILAIGLFSESVPHSYGYAADATCRLTGLDAHSSFHYEFTRVLAVAAGFDERDADYVLWPGTGMPPTRRDLQAHEFGRLIVDAVLGDPLGKTAPGGGDPRPTDPLGACLALGQPASSAQ